MVTTLLESGAKRKRSRGGLAASIVIHGALIGLGLAMGGQVAASTLEKPKAENVRFVPAPEPKVEPTKVHVAPKKEAPKPKAKAPAPKPAAPRVQAPAPVAPKQVAVAPAPKVDLPVNVPTIATPTTVPVGLPKIDPNAIATEIAAQASAGTASGSSSSSSAAGSSSDRATGESGGDVGVSRGDGSAWNEAQVDVAVQPLRVEPPRYPESLRSSGVSGTVIVRFVVGPDGRVEMGTVKVVDSPHDQFSEAVKTALRKARYRAGEVRGTKVRQLVEQSFMFQLQR